MKTFEIISEVVTMKQSNFSGEDGEFWTHRDTLYKIKTQIESGQFVQLNEYTKITSIESGERIKAYAMHDNEEYPVGIMELHPMKYFPIQNAYSVYSVEVKQDHRGMGIAKGLYLYALNQLNMTLLTGDTQTPGGQRNWAGLSNMPNVEVVGWAGIDKAEIGSMFDDPETEEYHHQIIDDLIGKVGAQFIGEDNYYAYFEFPISAGKKRVENLVKGTLIKVYQEYESGTLVTGLLARKEQ